MDTRETLDNGKTAHANVVHEWTPLDETGHHKNTQQIEHDIDETRHTMDMILDALNGKASPNTMYRRAVHYFGSRENRENVRKSLSDVADNITGSFQRNPLPVMMIAAGATWMLWETQRDGRHTSHDGDARGRFQNANAEAGERLQQARERTGEQSGAFQEKARESFYSAKERVASTIGGTRAKSEEYRQRAAELQGSAQHSIRRADSAVHNNPLLFGFAAAFAGIVAGLILPESKSERDIAGDKAAGIIEKTEEKGATPKMEKTANFARNPDQAFKKTDGKPSSQQKEPEL